MELKIDTAKDSREDIRRAIAFLQAFLAQSEKLQEATLPGSIIGPSIIPESPTPILPQPAIPESILPPAVQDAVPAAPAGIPAEALPSSQGPVQEPPSEDTIEIGAGALAMFDGVTNAPEVQSAAQAQEARHDAPATPEKRTAEEITKTHRMVSVAELLKDPVKVIFKKNDSELEEVQRLKKASKTTAENLRIIAYN